MAKKRAYHHGDLRRALLQEAVRIIHTQGVEALTLRAVGEKLGVSRTALYRHFTGKAALLAAVASEGFRMLRLRLVGAWERQGGGRDGLDAMGFAYVHFAVANPSHYRVMFGGFVDDSVDPALAEEGGAAFQALVDALIAQQQQTIVRGDAPVLLAQFIWATVHGIAMLAIDGLLDRRQTDLDALIRFANERIAAGISTQKA